jgi:hypothetical protein
LDVGFPLPYPGDSLAGSPGLPMTPVAPLDTRRDAQLRCRRPPV